MTRTLPLAAAATAVLAAAAMAAGATPQPTVSATPPALVFGEGTMISGTLAGGAAQAGKPVSLQQRPAGAKTYTTVFTGAADAAGGFAFPVTPGMNVRYRVRAGTKPAQTSGGVLVAVRSKVAFRVSDRTPRKNQRIRFSGLVTPALDGAPVLVQRKNSAGAYTTIARTVLRDAGDTSSQYSRRLRIGRAGTYRVSIPATTTISAGASVARVIRVHR
jgi:hypothetical protein